MKETRVELFKKYRQEISEMEDESSFTSKERVSRHVETMLDEKSNDLYDTKSIQLSYDDVLSTSEFYSKQVNTRPNPLTQKDRKDKIFQAILIIAIAIVLIAMAVVGILYLRGTKQ